MVETDASLPEAISHSRSAVSIAALRATAGVTEVAATVAEAVEDTGHTFRSWIEKMNRWADNNSVRRVVFSAFIPKLSHNQRAAS